MHLPSVENVGYNVKLSVMLVNVFLLAELASCSKTDTN